MKSVAVLSLFPSTNSTCAVGYHISIKPHINVESDHMKNDLFLLPPAELLAMAGRLC